MRPSWPPSSTPRRAKNSTRHYSPVTGGATGRGRPGVPSTALEARCAFERWRAVLAQLGADVFDQPDLGGHEAFLMAANELAPNRPLEELASLRAALPEFDVARSQTDDRCPRSS
jgi:hypothetical protein